jgi:ApaG protein
MSDIVELEGLRVSIDRIVYQNLESKSPLRPHCFIYFITIHNESELAVQIVGRKWVVTDSSGEITAVEGDGVVGQSPILEAGQKFSYNSFHLLDSDYAIAQGSYLGMDSKGRKVLTRIPKFEMKVPLGQA